MLPRAALLLSCAATTALTPCSLPFLVAPPRRSSSPLGGAAPAAQVDGEAAQIECGGPHLVQEAVYAAVGGLRDGAVVACPAGDVRRAVRARTVDARLLSRRVVAASERASSTSRLAPQVRVRRRAVPEPGGDGRPYGTGGRAEILSVESYFAMYFKRTTHAARTLQKSPGTVSVRPRFGRRRGYADRATIRRS